MTSALKTENTIAWRLGGKSHTLTGTFQPSSTGEETEPRAQVSNEQEPAPQASLLQNTHG